MKANWWIAVAVAALAVGAWYYYHKNCPTCREKWLQMKNRIASKMMEPKPEGG